MIDTFWLETAYLCVLFDRVLLETACDCPQTIMVLGSGPPALTKIQSITSEVYMVWCADQDPRTPEAYVAWAATPVTSYMPKSLGIQRQEEIVAKKD